MGWAFPILLLILVLIAFLLGKAIKPIARSPVFRIIFLPGLLTALVLRLLFCHITGAQAKKASIFSGDAPGLSYDPQDATFLGKLIMGTFPSLAMLICLGIILLNQTYWMPSAPEPDKLPKAAAFAENLSRLGHIFLESASDVARSAPKWLWRVVSEGDWSRVIGLYLIVAFLVWLPPHRKELRYALAGVAIVGVLVWLPFYLINKVKPGLATVEEYKLLLLLLRLAGVLIFALLVCVICVKIPSYIYRAAQRRKGKVSSQA